MTSPGMCGMRWKESAVGLLIPMCANSASAACEQRVDEHHKKKLNLTNTQKRDLYFLDGNESRKQRGLHFYVLLFLPCDSLQ